MKIATLLCCSKAFSHTSLLFFIFARSCYAWPASIPTATPALSSPTSLPTGNSNDKNADSSVNYHLLFVATAGTLLCMAAIFIQQRRKRKLDHATEHATLQIVPNFARQNTIDRRTRDFSLDVAVVERCQPTRERDEVPEGLNEQGEAPPPYAPVIKPPSIRDVETTRYLDDFSPQSIESVSSSPPAYIQDISSPHPTIHRETDLTQPIPAVTIERTGNTSHSISTSNERNS